MDLSVATWFYVFGDRLRSDPRSPDLPVHGTWIGATLQRLAATGFVSLDVVTRRGGMLWMQRVPTLLATRVPRNVGRRGLDGQVLARLAFEPLQVHRLVYRLNVIAERDGTSYLEMAQDEAIAAGLGVLSNTPRNPAYRSMIWDRPRLDAIEAEFEPIGEEWLAYCAAHPEFVEALKRDLRYVEWKEAGY